MTFPFFLTTRNSVRSTMTILSVFLCLLCLSVDGFVYPSAISRSQTLLCSFNPFGSMMGDMASSLLGGGPNLSRNPALDEAVQSLAPSWSKVRSDLEAKMTPTELEFRKNLEFGYGEGSPLHKIRLYDDRNQPEDVRVTFYRDSASWCPYCQKVWISLEEKKIPYRIEKVNMNCYGDKPPTFRRLQPSGQIPVATIDGTTYRQSNDILYALEELFPDHKTLLSPDRSRMQELLRLERQFFGSWMYWLTSGVNPEGCKDILREVDRELGSSGGPFFMGKEMTTVDCQFAPFLERAAASLLYFKGFQFRVAPGEPTEYPNVNRWFDAMEERPSYQLTKSDYYTHCWDLPPQLGGCRPEAGSEPFAAAVDGDKSLTGNRPSWSLPLEAHNGGIEPDWAWTGDEEAAKREAVERISANHEAIAKFAARGAGKKGMPPVMAPLSDPYATPSEAVVESVDACMQVVAMAILHGTDSQDTNMQSLATAIAEKGGRELGGGVIRSLRYVQERVGVPRDMKLPAARQLRAHLHWSMETIEKALR